MLVGTCCPQQPRKGHDVCQRCCLQALLEYCPQSGRLLIQFAESLLARAGDKVTRGLRYILVCWQAVARRLIPWQGVARRLIPSLGWLVS